jgi:hypothetical protein
MIIEEEKRCKISFEIRNFDSVKDIKGKLAMRINKQPCEIALLNKAGEEVTEEQEKRQLVSLLTEFS